MITTLLFLSLLASPKGLRRERPRPHKIHRQAERVVNLYYYHTKEILPLGRPSRGLVRRFFRCRVTGRRGPMDLKLIRVLRETADHFKSSEITVISAYRSPRFNMELRKKLHEVARRSMHTYGKAVDFTLPNVPPAKVARWLRKRRIGGVGFYNKSLFLHFDTGPVRSWRGT